MGASSRLVPLNLRFWACSSRQRAIARPNSSNRAPRAEDVRCECCFHIHFPAKTHGLCPDLLRDWRIFLQKAVFLARHFVRSPLFSCTSPEQPSFLTSLCVVGRCREWVDEFGSPCWGRAAPHFHRLCSLYYLARNIKGHGVLMTYCRHQFSHFAPGVIGDENIKTSFGRGLKGGKLPSKIRSTYDFRGCRFERSAREGIGV